MGQCSNPLSQWATERERNYKEGGQGQPPLRERTISQRAERVSLCSLKEECGCKDPGRKVPCMETRGGRGGGSGGSDWD